MRIIKLPDISTILPRKNYPDGYVIETFPALVTVTESGKFVSDYGNWFWNRRSYGFDGKNYQLECDEGVAPSFDTLGNGSCNLKDGDGNAPDLSVEMQSLLEETLNNRRLRGENAREPNPLEYGMLFDSSSFEFQDILGDFDNGSFKSSSDFSMFASALVLDDRIVGFDSNNRELLAVDLELNPLWRFKPDIFVIYELVSKPIIFGELVIQHFGPAKVTQSPAPAVDGVQYADKKHYHDATLYALDIKDGSQQWELDFENSIEDLVLSEDKLYVCSLNELYVIDPVSGDILEMITVDLPIDYNQSLHKNFLYVLGDWLFWGYQANASLLVYSLSTLKLERHIALPEPYTIKVPMHQPVTREMAFFALKSLGAKAYYHMSPLLVVDTNHLDADMEMDDGPEIDVQLKPSADDPKHVEIWIAMHDVPLDEAMLYAELHAQNQAYYHGRQGASFESVHITDNFNGKVHFQYSGSDRPKAEVEEKLALLRARFAKWASEEAFAAIDKVPKQEASLTTEYLLDK